MIDFGALTRCDISHIRYEQTRHFGGLGDPFEKRQVSIVRDIESSLGQ
jgi:hypothetical protein